jgi:hypothetical protein
LDDADGVHGDDGVERELAATIGGRLARGGGRDGGFPASWRGLAHEELYGEGRGFYGLKGRPGHIGESSLLRVVGAAEIMRM